MQIAGVEDLTVNKSSVLKLTSSMQGLECKALYWILYAWLACTLLSCPQDKINQTPEYFDALQNQPPE